MFLFDENGNYYEELETFEDGSFPIAPEDAYVWFFNAGTPINKNPSSFMAFGDFERIDRIEIRYRMSGFAFAKARYFRKVHDAPREEECSSPACKRRMKYVGKPCHWCGRN